MERTADFRRIAAGLSGAPVPAPKGPLPSMFMSLASELQASLVVIRKSLRYESVEASEINACRDRIAGLEKSISDLQDLGDLAPPPRRRHDLTNFRQGVLCCLYDDLRDLATKVQTEQVQEMRHETEVANFFSAPDSGLVRRKPPPMNESSDYGGTAPAANESIQMEALALLSSFETNMDQINEVRQKLGELASMVGVLATKAEEQHEIVETVLQDADTATGSVEEGAKQLKKANENKKSYNFYIVSWFIGSALFLLVFDFIDARFSWI